MARPKILVIDDDRAVSFALEHYFRAFGYAVDCAATSPRPSTPVSTIVVVLALVLIVVLDRLVGLVRIG